MGALGKFFLYVVLEIAPLSSAINHSTLLFPFAFIGGGGAVAYSRGVKVTVDAREEEGGDEGGADMGGRWCI